CGYSSQRIRPNLLLRLLVAKNTTKLAPAVTRRKEYDQTTIGHILSCGMLGANALFRLFFNINSFL
ncbi:MAG TPA: hypothetical protein VI423_09485, partial [Paenisporosarcina sp.]|nr:hypothetical protein [Paenisporosarcina sp.]